MDAVPATGREIRRIRHAALQHARGRLRALYRTHELPGRNELQTAHAALDAGQPATQPGIPRDYPDPQGLGSEDCAQP